MVSVWFARNISAVSPTLPQVASAPSDVKLPGKLKAVFTEGHVEFWNTQLTQMHNAVSYYAVASWAHGTEAFNLNITGPGNTKLCYCFKTKKVKAARMSSIYQV